MVCPICSATDKLQLVRASWWVRSVTRQLRRSETPSRAGRADDNVEEWEITAAGEQRFLERADGAWSLSRKISIGDIGGDVRQHILDHEEPPERIVFEGTEFTLDASYSGQMLPDGTGAGRDVIRWEFLDGTETTFVGVEQWSETEFAAAAGFVVEDYQFTHILPGSL